MGVRQDQETYRKIKELLDIPVDEPIFVLRAQDRYAPDAIRNYRQIVYGGTIIGEYMSGWSEQVDSIYNDFLKWQRDNRDHVKRPD